MTAGFVGFGVLLPVFARAVGRAGGPRSVTTALTVSGLATLGVALTPLSLEGGTTTDLLHAVAAGTGYVATAVSPALLARARLRGPTAAASYAVTAVSAAALVCSVAVPDVAGLCQRLGLGVVDVWFASVGAALLSGRRLPSRP